MIFCAPWSIYFSHLLEFVFIEKATDKKFMNFVVAIKVKRDIDDDLF